MPNENDTTHDKRFQELLQRNPPNRDLLINPTDHNVSRVLISYDDYLAHGYTAYIEYGTNFLGESLRLDNIIPLSIDEIQTIAIYLTEECGLEFNLRAVTPEFAALEFTNHHIRYRTTKPLYEKAGLGMRNPGKSGL